MTDRGALLGIDLGTSSVKILLREASGRTVKSKAAYREESPAAWWEAVCTALRAIDCSGVTAIGLSSQTGTYIVERKDCPTVVLGWRNAAGQEELDAVRAAYAPEVFLREIAMPHPPMVSYPIPRLRYVKAQYPDVTAVCQPKDFIVASLTGRRVTDYYTWRGLADPRTGQYSAYFLKELGVDPTLLPEVLAPTDLAGYVTEAVSGETGLPVGTPVYLGMNDFFASIVGMGIVDGGAFDITGTSEHFGVVDGTLSVDTPLVSGPYLDRYVSYGGTASSGASLDFMGAELGDLPSRSDDPAVLLERDPPIFLPYLSGERAPIFDWDAKGAFLGITRGCTKEDLAYAVCEGVAFSIYHICEAMGRAGELTRVTVSGGASKLALLNRIKAELFGAEFVTLKENDTSALGAAMAAGVGCGAFSSLADAARVCCTPSEIFSPTGNCRAKLLRRYAIYRRLYPALCDEMHAFGAVSGEDGP